MENESEDLNLLRDALKKDPVNAGRLERISANLSRAALSVSRIDETVRQYPDLMKQIFEEAGKFASNVLAPLNSVGDKKGITLENEMGFNPLDFGMIGATDNHNSSPGDTEEWDYRGSTGAFTGTAKSRLRTGHATKGDGLIIQPIYTQNRIKRIILS